MREKIFETKSKAYKSMANMGKKVPTVSRCHTNHAIVAVHTPLLATRRKLSRRILTAPSYNETVIKTLTTVTTRSMTTSTQTVSTVSGAASSTEGPTAKEWIASWRDKQDCTPKIDGVEVVAPSSDESETISETDQTSSDTEYESISDNSLQNIANEASVANENEEKSAERKKDIGYIPGKEMMGLTGGWMFGEVGLKTDDGVERSMEETLKGWYKNPAGSATTKKKSPKKEKVECEVPTASIGKDFGGMAGGWPSGEVGLKQFNKSGDVAGQRQEASELSVYLPLAIVSAAIVSGAAIFFFGVDISSLIQNVQGGFSDIVGRPETAGSASNGSTGAVITSTDTASLRTGGLVLLVLVLAALTASNAQRAIENLKTTASDSLKIGALMAVAAAVAYKIITE